MAKITSTPPVVKYLKTIQIEFESPEEEAMLHHVMNTLVITDLQFDNVSWSSFCDGIRKVTQRGSVPYQEYEIIQQLKANIAKRD